MRDCREEHKDEHHFQSVARRVRPLSQPKLPRFRSVIPTSSGGDVAGAAGSCAVPSLAAVAGAAAVKGLLVERSHATVGDASRLLRPGPTDVRAHSRGLVIQKLGEKETTGKKRATKRTHFLAG